MWSKKQIEVFFFKKKLCTPPNYIPPPPNSVPCMMYESRPRPQPQHPSQTQTKRTTPTDNLSTRRQQEIIVNQLARSNTVNLI